MSFSSLAEVLPDEVEPVRDHDSLFVYRLWSAVIVQAVADYFSEEHRGSAECWLFGDGGEANGFLALCDVLDLDAARVRENVLRAGSFVDFKRSALGGKR